MHKCILSAGGQKPSPQVTLLAVGNKVPSTVMYLVLRYLDESLQHDMFF